MNRIYKINWNGRRGIYVISSEKGNTHRGVLSRIFLATSMALASTVVFAAGSYELDPSSEVTTITQSSWVTDIGDSGFWGNEERSVVFKVTGKHLLQTNGQDVSASALATSKNGSYRAVSVAADAGSQLEMVGNFNLTAQAEGNSQARGLALDSGKYVFNGDFDIKAYGKNSNGNNSNVLGVFIGTAGTSDTEVTFSGSKTSISAIREANALNGAGSEGVQIGINSAPIQVTFNAAETYIHSENYGYTADALNLQGENVLTNINSDQTLIEAVSDRWAQALVICYKGDILNVNNGYITLSSKLVDPKVDGVQAMVATGISQYEGQLNVGSNVSMFSVNVDNGGEGSVNASEIQQSAIGFLMQGTASIASDHFDISVANARGSTEGTWTEGLTVSPYIIGGNVGDDGNITIASKTITNINVSSKTDARGINNSGLLTVNGVANVKALSVAGQAVAINAEGTIDSQDQLGDGTAIFNGLTHFYAKSETGDATAVRITDASSVHLNGLTDISAEAGNTSQEVGVDLSASGALSVMGNVTVTAAIGMSLANDYSLSIGSEASTTENASLTINGLVKVADKDVTGSTSVTKAIYRVNGDGSSIGDVNITKSGVVEFGSGNYSVGNVTGDDTKVIKINDLSSKISIASVSNRMTYAGTGLANDSATNAMEAANALIDAFEVGGDRIEAGNQIRLEEGLINDSLSATVGKDGELENVTLQKNSKLDALGSMASLSMLSWRHETNSLIKRMGELRDAPQGIGSWVRAYGSKQSFGNQNVEQTSTSIQIGSDYDIGAGWKLGVAFSYTDSSSSYSLGDADGDAYSLAAYGTWLGDNGNFIDVIAKYGRLSTDFNFDSMKGGYDNNAFSLSIEYGHRFDFSQLAFVEPQVELSYTSVLGNDFSTDKAISISQDDFNSLVGRIGIRGGFFFPEKAGTIYARFSVLNDFMGDCDALVTNGLAKNSIHDDVGGVGVEYGIGANYHLTTRTSGYIDLERTSGNDVTEDWRWNVGVRHVW